MPKKFIKQLTATAILSGTIITALIALPSSVLADTATAGDAQTAVQAGVQYIANNQNSDGSISGFSGASEWSAVAVEANGQQASDITSTTGGTSLTDFVAADVPPPGAPATTIERDMIAISASGGDTAASGGVDYNAALASQDVGNQIGDPTLLNDDSFGVIAASASHDAALAPVAQDGLNYLLAHQGTDGGFSYTTATCSYCGSDSNDTAAAIIAMYAAQGMGLVQSNPSAQSDALAYLLSTQQADGGFAYDTLSPSDGGSTAWGLMALNAIGNSVAAQAQLARNWLLNDQNPDGGFSYGAYGITASDTTTTAHAIIALLGSTWLLSPAPTRPPVQTSSQSSGNAGQTAQTPSGTSQTSIAPTLTYAGTGLANTQTTDVQANATPQPIAAGKSTNKQSGKTLGVSVAKSKISRTVYAVLILCLVALTWFVLESRPGKEVK